MKKVLLIVIVLSAFTLGSCKKNYTCTCRDSSGGYTATTVKDTKKKATSYCADQQTSWHAAGFTDVSCSL